ncbi:hypothetical protein D3C83_39450 [compost metagenome]
MIVSLAMPVITWKPTLRTSRSSFNRLLVPCANAWGNATNKPSAKTIESSVNSFFFGSSFCSGSFLGARIGSSGSDVRSAMIGIVKAASVLGGLGASLAFSSASASSRSFS